MQESMQEEGKMLAASPYGPMILQALARVYDLQADIYLGGEPLQQEMKRRLPTPRHRIPAIFPKESFGIGTN